MLVPHQLDDVSQNIDLVYDHTLIGKN
jgi:hypothetical protein